MEKERERVCVLWRKRVREKVHKWKNKIERQSE